MRELSGANRGIFTGKPDPDTKYSHIRGLFAYYALTGDERAADSIQGRAASGWSSAIASTVKPWSLVASWSACHTGRSNLQPHQEAQLTRNTFRPR